MPQREKGAPCAPACTRVIKFMTDQEVNPNVGVSIPGYDEIDGFRHINLFVRFSQEKAEEPPVDLGVVFAFDQQGTMGARRYVNLEENLTWPQTPNFINVTGSNTWHGSPHNVSTYIARLPIMGPFVEVFVYNRAAVKRKVSVWGYLVS